MNKRIIALQIIGWITLIVLIYAIPIIIHVVTNGGQ